MFSIALHRSERFRHVACDLAHPAVVAAAVLPALRELVLDKPSAVTLINNAAVRRDDDGHFPIRFGGLEVDC